MLTNLFSVNAIPFPEKNLNNICGKLGSLIIYPANPLRDCSKSLTVFHPWNNKFDVNVKHWNVKVHALNDIEGILQIVWIKAAMDVGEITKPGIIDGLKLFVFVLFSDKNELIAIHN